MTKNNNIYKIVCCIVVLLILFFAGFLTGRLTNKETIKTVIEYRELAPIHDTIINIKPIYEEAPVDTANVIRKCIEDGIYTELFPTKIITEYVELSKDDTSSVINDWATIRVYEVNLFDIDTVGRCSVKGTIQYNRMDSLSYMFYPVQKTTETYITTTKTFSPFIGVGFDINDIKHTPTFDFQAEAGFFIKEKYGISANYRYDVVNKTHSLGGMVIYKF